MTQEGMVSRKVVNTPIKEQRMAKIAVTKVVATEALPEMATQPMDSPYVRVGAAAEDGARDGTYAVAEERSGKTGNRRAGPLSMMEEMFFVIGEVLGKHDERDGDVRHGDGADVSADAAASAGVRLPLKICRKVKLGYHSMELNSEKSMIFSASTLPAMPMIVKIAASR